MSHQAKKKKGQLNQWVLHSTYNDLASGVHKPIESKSIADVILLGVKSPTKDFVSSDTWDAIAVGCDSSRMEGGCMAMPILEIFKISWNFIHLSAYSQKKKREEG